MAKAKTKAEKKKKEKAAAKTAKKPKKAAKSAKSAKKGGFLQYLREVRQEMKRVSWPRRDEVIASTVLVLAVVLFFVVYVGLLDVIFIRLVKYLTFNF